MKRNVLIGDLQTIVLSFQSIADIGRPENLVEYDRVLVIHILYVIEVTERQPSISTRCLAACTSTSYTPIRCMLTLQEQQLYPKLIQTV
jgi:hypothetical protein